MTDTTDTDDLTPDGEGTPLGEAERSRDRKDERIRELGGYTEAEIREVAQEIAPDILPKHQPDPEASIAASARKEASERLFSMLEE